VDRVDDGAGVLERAARAVAVFAADPAGIDEPAVGVGGFHAVGQHGGVVVGVEDDEGGAVAGRESGDGLEDTIFSSWRFRCVTSQEVVASLLGGELANGWQHTESITGQHDDVAGVVLAQARNACIGDVLDRVCATCVFRDGDIVVVGDAREGVVDDVFEDGAEADGVEDFGFL